LARQGLAWQGKAWIRNNKDFYLIFFDKAWRGTVWRDMARRGRARQGEARRGTARLGMAWLDQERAYLDE